MATVIFTFNGKQTIIQCKKEEKMKDICNKFISKIGININSVYFLYGGKRFNLELTFNEQANLIDNNLNEMNILVYETKNTTIINENNSMKISKEIICPICYNNCRINFKDYKIKLYSCKNGHEINNILLNEYYYSQNINESKIICNNCNKINKSKTYNNQFFKCLTCNINLCPLCK